MSETIFRSKIDDVEYDRGRAGCLIPEDIEPGKAYTERRILSPSEAQELGTYAVDRLVKVIKNNTEESGASLIPVKDANEDGSFAETAPRDCVVNESGIILSDSNGVVGFEEQGYFLHGMEIEDSLAHVEEGKQLVPVRLRESPPPLKALEMPLPIENPYQ